MRSLEECRAEVFARSEKKIAKRRKTQRRLIAGLCPLCLCVVLLASLPSFEKNYECMPEAFENAECAGEAESDAMDIAKQEAAVIPRDGERWILSEPQTEQLARTLDAYLTDGKRTEDQKTAEYEIEIPKADGMTVRYLLSGRKLTGHGWTVELAEDEWHQLLELLHPDP